MDQESIARLQNEAAFRKGVIDKASEGLCVGHAAPYPQCVEFTVWNDKMVALTGYTRDEINRIGWPAALHHTPQGREKAGRTFAQLGQGQEVYALEREIVCKSGERKTVQISTSLLDMGDGRVHMLAVVLDVTARKRHEALLVEQATKDFLTGVANRRAVFERLEQEIDRAARVGGDLSVLLFDIDHFKHINDTYGHQVGDETLRQVSARIAGHLRGYDAVGRFGGEEFLVVAPEVCLNSACAVADRIRNCIAATPLCTEGAIFSVTASAGVSQFAPGDTVDSLIKRADDNLYAAKNAGRNSVRCQGA